MKSEKKKYSEPLLFQPFPAPPWTSWFQFLQPHFLLFYLLLSATFSLLSPLHLEVNKWEYHYVIAGSKREPFDLKWFLFSNICMVLTMLINQMGILCVDLFLVQVKNIFIWTCVMENEIRWQQDCLVNAALALNAEAPPHEGWLIERRWEPKIACFRFMMN